MRLLWSVDPKEEFSRDKIPQIFYSLWSCVRVVVASFTVMAETVGVLHTQIKTLGKKPRTHKFLSVSQAANISFSSGTSHASVLFCVIWQYR